MKGSRDKKLSTTEDTEDAEDIKLFSLIPEAAISPSSVAALLRRSPEPNRTAASVNTRVDRDAA